MISVSAEKNKQSADEVQDFNAAFRSATHWKGADGAMSVKLNDYKYLWLFGDTWIVNSPSSPSRKMISNSVATMEPVKGAADMSKFTRLKPSCDLVEVGANRWNFWFGGTPQEPSNIFKAKESGTYYWPGCGTEYGGRLYLLLKKIRKKDDPSPLFQFDWYGEDLLVVQNPQDPPNVWDYTIHAVSDQAHEVQYGLACTIDQNYFYSLCYLQETPDAGKKTILARMALNDLASSASKKWQYWCVTDASPKGAWEAGFRNAKDIIPDGGPEMSMFFQKGMNCFVTVYQPPLSPIVNLRVARKIEGPWSKAISIFKIPEIKLADGKRTALVYAGKAHEGLSGGEVITYSFCANPGGLEEHIANPKIYYPTFRSFSLPRKTVDELLNAVPAP